MSNFLLPNPYSYDFVGASEKACTINAFCFLPENLIWEERRIVPPANFHINWEEKTNFKHHITPFKYEKSKYLTEGARF